MAVESRPLQPVPSQPPLIDIDTQIPPMTPPQRHGPPTSSTVIVPCLKLVQGLLVVLALFFFFSGTQKVIVVVRDQLHTEQAQKCVLPAYPEHGTYIVTNASAPKPGDNYETLNMTVICINGYGVLGTETVSCRDGSWSDSIPKCVRLCKLDKHPSVYYYCPVSGSIKGRRACTAYEPSGTVVRPKCNSPNYYSVRALRSMRCIDGSWNYVAVCSPECGRITPKRAEALIIGGGLAEQGQLPWYVGIYRKTTTHYMQICGGSLVSNRVVISAAHCFWYDVSKLLPASKFVVTAGKIYRPWNNPRDVQTQQNADVKEIKIPARFQGSASNYQDDIAVLILKAAFVFNPFVRPICLDFDVDFDRRQLQPGKLGKVAGWGLTSENGMPSQILKVVDLPYVDINECIAASPLTYRVYITSDKICAGFGNGTALCKGDSGGGLAFPESESGKNRYYLRAIVSTAPANENLCNSNTFTSFTKILKHENFVRDYL